MINIGIVGSSYSYGRNVIRGDHPDIFLIDIFKEYNKNEEFDFYSLAKWGIGTETYLSNVIFLKQQYNIKILFIELIENRELASIKLTVPEGISSTLKRLSNKNKFIQLYKSRGNEIKHIGYIGRGRQTQPRREGQTVFNDEIVFLTIHDIIQTLNLCELLNIKPILWSFNVAGSIIRLACNLKLHINRFDNFYTVFERFFKKYNGNEELFTQDGYHLNYNANIELVKDFLLPKITEKY